MDQGCQPQRAAMESFYEMWPTSRSPPACTYFTRWADKWALSIGDHTRATTCASGSNLHVGPQHQTHTLSRASLVSLVPGPHLLDLPPPWFVAKDQNPMHVTAGNHVIRSGRSTTLCSPPRPIYIYVARPRPRSID